MKWIYTSLCDFLPGSNCPIISSRNALVWSLANGEEVIVYEGLTDMRIVKATVHFDKDLPDNYQWYAELSEEKFDLVMVLSPKMAGSIKLVTVPGFEDANIPEILHELLGASSPARAVNMKWVFNDPNNPWALLSLMPRDAEALSLVEGEEVITFHDMDCGDIWKATVHFSNGYPEPYQWYVELSEEKFDLAMIFSPKEAGEPRLMTMPGFEDVDLQEILSALPDYSATCAR